MAITHHDHREHLQILILYKVQYRCCRTHSIFLFMEALLASLTQCTVAQNFQKHQLNQGDGDTSMVFFTTKNQSILVFEHHKSASNYFSEIW